MIHEGVTVAALQALLSADSPFTRVFEFRVQSIGSGECYLHVPFNKMFERPGGTLSEQVFMTAADVATWLAIKTERGLGDSSTAVSSQTSFLRSAGREAVVCRARLLRLGTTLSHATAECFNQNGILLSHHSLTYMRRQPQGENEALVSTRHATV